MKIPSQFETPEFRKALIEFTKMRKKKKKPLTNHAMDLILGKLGIMTSDVKVAVKILEQSIVNSWQGLFPLKEELAKPKIKKVANGLDDAPHYTPDEVSKHWKDVLKSLKDKEVPGDSDEVPF